MDPQIIHGGTLCDNITWGSISYWQSSSNLFDGGIVELSLYAIIFSFHDKIGSMGEEKDQRTHAFHILEPSFFSWCEEYNLLLPLLRNGCACFLIDPFVFWHFYKVLFGSIHLFWIRINCKGVQSQEVCHFATWNLFNHQFWFEKLRFQLPK